jgi:hypothetical protein
LDEELQRHDSLRELQSPNGPCGILQITVDFSDQTDLDPKEPVQAHHLLREEQIRLRLRPRGAIRWPWPTLSAWTHGHKGLFGGILVACGEGLQPMGGEGSDFPTDPPLPHPKNGPLGFSFKMAVDADDQGAIRIGRRSPFPTTKDRSQISEPDPDWLTMFATTAVEPDKSKGECHYSSLPTNGPGACQIP